MLALGIGALEHYAASPGARERLPVRQYPFSVDAPPLFDQSGLFVSSNEHGGRHQQEKREAGILESLFERSYGHVLIPKT
jgi:hypothetical protein